MMAYKHMLVLMLLLAATLATGGCAEKKKTRGVTIHGPETEVSVEVETTDKNPDD